MGGFRGAGSFLSSTLASLACSEPGVAGFRRISLFWAGIRLRVKVLTGILPRKGISWPKPSVLARSIPRTRKLSVFESGCLMIRKYLGHFLVIFGSTTSKVFGQKPSVLAKAGPSGRIITELSYFLKVGSGDGPLRFESKSGHF